MSPSSEQRKKKVNFHVKNQSDMKCEVFCVQDVDIVNLDTVFDISL